MGGCPDSGSLPLVLLVVLVLASRPFVCGLRLLIHGFVLTLRLWRGGGLRRFSLFGTWLLTPFSPSARRCPRSPKIAAARPEAPRLVRGYTSQGRLILMHRQADTHQHHINAQRDSWTWQCSCSGLHLSSCKTQMYPGCPSSDPRSS